MSKSENYSKTFSQLCHIVALSKDGRIPAAIDNLILTIFGIDERSKPENIDEILEAIEAYFNLELERTLVQSSVERLIQANKLHKHNNRLLITPHTLAIIKERIIKSSEAEEKVRDEWFASFSGFDNPVPDEWHRQLWNCLKAYMAKAFQRHGIETTLLLYPKLEIRSEDRKHLSVYLQEAIARNCPDIPSERAIHIISSFFTTITDLRTTYVAQLLDATFTYFALTVDEIASEYLNGNIPRLALFLDTNFIFGLLDLSSSPLSHVTKELIEIIKLHNLPFTLYYHEKTLEEFLSAIQVTGNRLKGKNWTQALSIAAVKSGYLSGIELRYHEKNASSPIAPDIFLSKYEHAKDLLDGYGFKIFRSSGKNKTQDAQKYNLVAEYEHFIQTNRRRGPKAYEVLNHDIVVWQTVGDLRKNGSSVLDAGAFFLSIDYYLYSFDWQHLREAKNVGKVVLPNHFLQILRPFLPVDYNFDRRFVETFAIPEFRSIEADYSTTTSKILSYLSIYRDIDERTALRILTNTLLCDRLQNIDEASEEFKAIVDNTLIEENAQLVEKVQTLTEEAQKAKELAKEKQDLLQKREKDILNLGQDYHHAKQSAELSTSEVAELTELLQLERERTKQKEAELSKTQQERVWYQLGLRITLGLIVFMVGLLMTFVLIPKIPGFSTHQHKIGIYLAGVLITIGLSCAVTDTNSKRRVVAFGTFVVGVVIELIQVL